MLIRRPHVAGSFYPSNPPELRQYCDKRLDPSFTGQTAKAVILPHAGYVYSGDTACMVLSKVKVPDTVFLLGPNHFGQGSQFALYPEGEWETPLGKVPVSTEAASFLKVSPQVQADPSAHSAEHSLEVLLPLLQTRNASVSVIPFIIGTLDLYAAHAMALKIGGVLKSSAREILVAVSTDMNHYESEAATRVKDRYALDAILALDEKALVNAVGQHRISMCGFVPVCMLLAMKDLLGITKATLVDYRTSADASNDTSRVIGYAGFIFE